MNWQNIKNASIIFFSLLYDIFGVVLRAPNAKIEYKICKIFVDIVCYAHARQITELNETCVMCVRALAIHRVLNLASFATPAVQGKLIKIFVCLRHRVNDRRKKWTKMFRF